MRTFTTHDGERWQAALLYGSFGSVLLVFSRIEGDEIRQYPMYVANFAEAERELAAMDTEALRETLEAAEPWT